MQLAGIHTNNSTSRTLTPSRRPAPRSWRRYERERKENPCNFSFLFFLCVLCVFVVRFLASKLQTLTANVSLIDNRFSGEDTRPAPSHTKGWSCRNRNL